jgi:hypothetical protein
MSVEKFSKKHPNIWSFIQLIRSKHVRFEHISIQLDAGVSVPKQSTKKRFDTLYDRFLDKGNQRKGTFIRFIIVNWKKTKLLLYCQFSLVFFSLN